jgi:hypothetical protein
MKRQTKLMIVLRKDIPIGVGIPNNRGPLYGQFEF